MINLAFLNSPAHLFTAIEASEKPVENASTSRKKNIATIAKHLMFLNTNVQEHAENQLHLFTGKSKTAQLTDAEIVELIPKLTKLVKEKGE